MVFYFWRWMKWIWPEDCKNKPNVFCYICGNYTIVPHRNLVTSFINYAYNAYFGMKLGDHDKAWEPHMVCKRHARKSCLKFGIPMVLGKLINHITDWYFCTIDWQQQIEPKKASNILIVIQQVVCSSLWWNSTTCPWRISWY